MTTRILLVCADPQLAAQVRAGIDAPGTEIVQVASPARALAMFDEGERYDIVVADADMTPTGGFALSREVKARALMGRDMPPVVLLIARGDDRWLASWSRADAHVRKPPDPFDLDNVVRALEARQEVPALPGIGAPGAAVAGDIFGIGEGVPVPETALSAGP